MTNLDVTNPNVTSTTNPNVINSKDKDFLSPEQLELFTELVFEEKTVRVIRQEMIKAGYDLSKYDDATLVCKMLDILKGE